MAKQKQHAEASERQLVRDIQELTGRQFVYEDLWCGMVPFDGGLTELQTGPPVSFADLTWREQADILREFIPWGQYPDKSWDDLYRIRDNIASGKEPEQWLEGTSLHQSFRLLADGKTPPPPKQSPEITKQDLVSLRDALAGATEERSPGKAQAGKLSLQDLKELSQAQAKQGEDQKGKPREIER